MLVAGARDVLEVRRVADPVRRVDHALHEDEVGDDLALLVHVCFGRGLLYVSGKADESIAGVGPTTAGPQVVHQNERGHSPK